MSVTLELRTYLETMAGSAVYCYKRLSVLVSLVHLLL